MPNGWTRTSDTTATYSVTFANVACTPVAPQNPGVVQATCTNGVVTTPTITPASTSGVTYALSPPGPYVGTTTVNVTVTATLANGFAWVASMPAGWTWVNATTATFTVKLTAASCTQTTPAAPTVKQAECTGGTVTAPTLSFATTDGITYSANPSSPPPYAPGQVVTVTATLRATGVAWPAPTLPAGWTRTSDTTATFTVTFATATCTPVAPVNPNVVQAKCAAGVVTAPSVTPTPVAGISYVVAPPGSFDGTVTTAVTVTATLANGYAWVDPLPTGWKRFGPTTATFSVTLVGASCLPLSPVAPSVVEAVCVAGALTEPTLMITSTPVITYTTDVPVHVSAGADGGGDGEVGFDGCRVAGDDA